MVPQPSLIVFQHSLFYYYLSYSYSNLDCCSIKLQYRHPRYVSRVFTLLLTPTITIFRTLSLIQTIFLCHLVMTPVSIVRTYTFLLFANVHVCILLGSWFHIRQPPLPVPLVTLLLSSPILCFVRHVVLCPQN